VTKNLSIDAVQLSRDLIRCDSVTPKDGGALDVLQAALESLGFKCERLAFSEPDHAEVKNLYARLGTEAPNFCFAGHTDVVPVGARDAWTADPFGAEVRDGVLYGRGASDMKSAIAAFISATAATLSAANGKLAGSISFLITGDEEGEAVNGTRKVLEWMQENGETIDACLVGEPTNPMRLGEMIKIGRRGSVNAAIMVAGTQGHVAYPDLADNPVPKLIGMLDALLSEPLDSGTDHFQASRVEITTIDVGNAATNVIPASASAKFNIRFNDLHTSQSIIKWIGERLKSVPGEYELTTHITGEAFLTPPGQLSDIIAGAVRDSLGIEPELSTNGGTSDARFIKDYAPVAEFGLVGQTMHKVDERIAIADIEALTDIYSRVLAKYFGL
jgi:succinyl-diaminopimelate desuccinylase